jgi:hypothetical protein
MGANPSFVNQLYLGFSFHSLAFAVHAGAENETMITLNATEGQDLKRAFDELHQTTFEYKWKTRLAAKRKER